jgi:hypothetical protein
LVALGWLVAVIAITRVFRVAAISDARSDAQLSQRLARTPFVGHRAASAYGSSERLRREHAADAHKAAG